MVDFSDPTTNAGLTGGIGAVGLAGGLFGSMESVSGSKMGYQAGQQIANLELQAEAQRRQAMEISARRQQLQNVRNAQQASSMNLAAATAQGAQFGSAGAAGQSQPGAEAAYSNLGISQNLQIGEQLFGINAQIDEQKMIQSEAQSNVASGQGMSALFGGIGKSAGSIGQLATLLPALAL